MKVLGVSYGAGSTAALMIDGQVIAAASEERFGEAGKREKNDMRFPIQAIDYCLKEGNISSEDLDLFCIATLELPPHYHAILKFSSFTIADYVRAQNDIWKPRLYEGKTPKWTEVFKDKLDFDQWPHDIWDKIPYETPDAWPIFKDLLHDRISQKYGLGRDKIIHVEHHETHAYYAYFASPIRDKECLAITIDAFGDNISATISEVKNNEITRIMASPDREEKKAKNMYLGKLYRYITLLLGMKPNEHEYKLMGLAAYAQAVEKIMEGQNKVMVGPYDVFKETMQVDGIEFKYNQVPQDSYFYFKERLEGFRFDGIAGALQKYVEETLSEWVQNAIKETGIKTLVFSGGVAMNIKAMQQIAELDEVEDMFIAACPSDESLAIGVGYVETAKRCPDIQLKPLQNGYLGPMASRDDEAAMIKSKNLSATYEIVEDYTPDQVVDYLVDGKIIGRCAGRMEFGARALGNRSILADPRDAKMLRNINVKIKKRDFWMPFTPSMIDEDAGRYLDNPKKIRAPFMTVAFNSTPESARDLPAAVHPADETVRPQVVTQDANPGYYELIKCFKDRTGVGSLLNTSFNLHGFPIVNTPEHALFVFENSGIDVLVLNHYLVIKKS